MGGRGGGLRKGSGGRCVPIMTERCSLWSALSAAACCFYRGSFMQVQVSEHKIFLRLFLPFVGACTCVCLHVSACACCRSSAHCWLLSCPGSR